MPEINDRTTLESLYASVPILITGSTGFLGSNLIAPLRDLNAHITGFGADIRDQQAVERAVVGQAIIFHMAGVSGAVDSNLHPFDDLDVNCKGLLVLLEACRKVNPEVRIIFPSSRLVYGHPQSLSVKETHPTHPLSIYGIHKLAAEHYLRLYSALYGLQTVALRITNPYGPNHVSETQKYSVLNVFMKLAKEGRTINIYGDGAQLRDFIYIGDLIEALLWVAQSPRAFNDVFNVSGGQAISLLEAAETIVSVVGRGKIQFIPWPKSAELVETGDFLADIGKICDTIGWQPHTPFATGIRKSLDMIEE